MSVRQPTSTNAVRQGAVKRGTHELGIEEGERQHYADHAFAGFSREAREAIVLPPMIAFSHSLRCTMERIKIKRPDAQRHVQVDLLAIVSTSAVET